jgi:microcin C transport system substrate-binding protein
MDQPDAVLRGCTPIDSFWENTHLEARACRPSGTGVLEPFRDQPAPEVFTEALYRAAIGPRPHLRPAPGAPCDGLLEEAGWVPGDDGMLRNAAGETLEVEFLNAGPLFDRIINPYVENLRAIGVDAS